MPKITVGPQGSETGFELILSKVVNAVAARMRVPSIKYSETNLMASGVQSPRLVYETDENEGSIKFGYGPPARISEWKSIRDIGAEIDPESIENEMLYSLNILKTEYETDEQKRSLTLHARNS